MSKPVTHKGNITIGRVTQTGGDAETKRYYSIQIQNEPSHTMLLEIDIAGLDYLDATHGLGCVPCEYRLYAPELASSTRETADFQFATKREGLTSLGQAALESARMEGWRFRDESIHNWRNVKDGKVCVMGTRFRDTCGDVVMPEANANRTESDDGE